MKANPFILCNLAAKATRILHRNGERVEEDLKLLVQQSEEFLTKGTPTEVDRKNLRGSLAFLSFQ